MRLPTVPPRRHALVLLGLVHLGMIGTVLRPSQFNEDRAVFFEGLPVNVRVLLWGVSGALILAAGVAGGRRVDVAAFFLACLMPLERGIAHGLSWLHWWLPDPPGGDPYGWGPAVLWCGFAGIVGLLSTLRDVPDQSPLEAVP